MGLSRGSCIHFQGIGDSRHDSSSKDMMALAFNPHQSVNEHEKSNGSESEISSSHDPSHLSDALPSLQGSFTRNALGLTSTSVWTIEANVKCINLSIHNQLDGIDHQTCEQPTISFHVTEAVP